MHCENPNIVLLSTTHGLKQGRSSIGFSNVVMLGCEEIEQYFHTNSYLHTCMCVCVYVFVCACVHARVHICVRACVCVCKWVILVDPLDP